MLKKAQERRHVEKQGKNISVDRKVMYHTVLAVCLQQQRAKTPVRFAVVWLCALRCFCIHDIYALKSTFTETNVHFSWVKLFVNPGGTRFSRMLRAFS